MEKVLHKNFHIIKKLKPGKSEAYILAKWKPDKDIWLFGAAIGLLCCKNNNFELYLAISKNSQLKGEYSEFFVPLKKDWLFYQQRDVYGNSDGINDLVSYHFLPEGKAFFIKKGETIYIKVGALNKVNKALEYDAFCNLYYTLADKK